MERQVDEEVVTYAIGESYKIGIVLGIPEGRAGQEPSTLGPGGGGDESALHEKEGDGTGDGGRSDAGSRDEGKDGGSDIDEEEGADGTSDGGGSDAGASAG